MTFGILEPTEWSDGTIPPCIGVEVVRGARWLGRDDGWISMLWDLARSLRKVRWNLGWSNLGVCGAFVCVWGGGGGSEGGRE